MIKMRKMKSYRLEDVTINRLEHMALQLEINQTELIEELINACFDTARSNYEKNNFDNFVQKAKERVDIVNNKKG